MSFWLTRICSNCGKVGSLCQLLRLQRRHALAHTSAHVPPPPLLVLQRISADILSGRVRPPVESVELYTMLKAMLAAQGPHVLDFHFVHWPTRVLHLITDKFIWLRVLRLPLLLASIIPASNRIQ